MAKRNLCHGKAGNRHARRRADSVDGLVGKLERGDGSLGIEAHELGQGTHNGHGERRQARARGNEQGEQAKNDVHKRGVHGGRRSGECGGKCLEDGVDDHAALGDDQNAASNTDNDGGVRKVGKALNELLGNRLLIKTAQDAGKQAHTKEHGGNLIHVPALGNKAPDDNTHTASEIDQYELLAGGELLLDGSVGHRELNALELVVLIRNGRLGVFLYAHGIAHSPCDTDGGEDNPRNGAQPQLRIALDTNDALGDQNVKRINGRGAVSQVRTEEADDKCRHRVIADAHHDGNEDGVERQGFLRHTKRSAANGQQGHRDGNDEDVLILELFNHAAHAGIQRIGLGDDCKRTANQQDERDDVGRRLDTLGGRLQNRKDILTQVDGLTGLGIGIVLIDLFIGSGNGDFALARRRRDCLALILARGNDPGQDRKDNDQQEHDRIDVR